MNFIEECWEQREEIIYKFLFNGLGEGIYPINSEVFQNQFQREEIDPMWLHYGVFKCPPSQSHSSWVYVTSGMSNPWETDVKKEYSGIGEEFILETNQDSTWPILVLHSLMAFNILLSIGHYGDKPILDYGDRMALSIEPNLTNVMAVEPKDFPVSFELKSGKVDFLQIVGITDTEVQFAKGNSSAALSELIYEKFGTLSIIPNRDSTI